MRRHILLSIFVLSCWGTIAADETTRTLFNKFSNDLEGAWRDYASDKQKDAREKLISDLKESFNQKINKAAPPPGLKVQQVVSFFIDKISDSKSLFRLDKMKSARTAYEAGCQLLFKREFASASDIADARTTQKAFDLSLAWFEDARDALRQAVPEAQTLAYNSVNEAATILVKGATIPPDIDHIAQLDKNLQEARKRFPTNNPVLAKANTPILSMLEARAKDIQQRSVKR